MITQNQTITKEFKTKVCEEIRLLEEGENRFRVFTPFRFDDGDHFSIVLKKEKNQWLLSDEGHTYLHLSYTIDLEDLAIGKRREIIENTLQEFQLEDRYGEIIVKIDDNEYGEALYRLAQGLINIYDITYLSREIVTSTFYEDFRLLIEENVPKNKYEFQWYDKINDPDGDYKVDYVINNLKTPLYIYGLGNDNRVRDANISLLQFDKWGHKFFPIAIFDNQEKINKKVLNKFNKVCNKSFASLKYNRSEIVDYLRQMLSNYN